MRKLKEIFIIILLILLPLSAYCQEDTSAQAKSIVLEQGEAAPWNGLLLNKEAAQKVLQAQDRCELDCKYKLEAAALDSELVVETLKLQLESQRKQSLAIIEQYDSELKALAEAKLEDDDDIMWIAVGAGVGVGVTSIIFGVLWNVL